MSNWLGSQCLQTAIAKERLRPAATTIRAVLTTGMTQPWHAVTGGCFAVASTFSQAAGDLNHPAGTSVGGTNIE